MSVAVPSTVADDVLTPEALAFVGDLQRRFGPRRDELLVQDVVAEEFARIVDELGDPDGPYEQARRLFERLALDDLFVDFLTVAAFDLVD